MPKNQGIISLYRFKESKGAKIRNRYNQVQYNRMGLVRIGKSECLKFEVEFWRAHAKALNEKGVAIFEQKIAEFFVFSDASGTSYEGYAALCATP